MDSTLLLGLLAAIVNGAAVWGWYILRQELGYMRRAINAAHRRLDMVQAPPAGGNWLPD